MSLDSTTTNSKIAQGVIALLQRQPAQAIQYFNQVQQLDPSITSIYKYRGLAYQQQGKKAAAIADWQKAAKLYKQYSYDADYRLVQKWLSSL